MEKIIHRINDPTDLEKVEPEESKEHPGFYYYPDDKRVLVSRYGKVINAKTGKVLKGNVHKDKSIFFFISTPGRTTSSYRLARLVAKTFTGRPSRHLDKSFSKLQVNHCDGDRLNNNVTNLEWVTGPENTQHAHHAELHPLDLAVLAKHVDTGEIKRFVSTKACAEFFGVTRSTFWKHVTKGNLAKFHKGGFIFKFDDASPWPYIDKTMLTELGKGREPQSVVVKVLKENKAFVLGSLTETAEFAGITLTKLWRALKKTKKYVTDSFSFEFLSDMTPTI